MLHQVIDLPKVSEPSDGSTCHLTSNFAPKADHVVPLFPSRFGIFDQI